MKFMILLKATAETEAGIMPDEKLLTEMTAYNEALVQAGVLLGGEGLHPTSAGVKVLFDGASRELVAGPFAAAPGTLIAGFWIFETPSLEEAVRWVKRCPNPTGQRAEIEIRRIFTLEDFGDAMSPDLREREKAMEAEIAGHRG
ncbi:YciI family protein [Niveispirillum irakense]|uniref:YciI family protein n=1 Tax=Niveispirillum irakense TaxID=34011 RepID=UPI000428BDDB|nr:YciI family protein [Niveispirillum irakense]